MTEPDRGLAIAAVARHLRENPFAVESWPPGHREISFVDLLERHAPNLGAELKQSMLLAEALFSVPIVAIAGLNDQGKSSLVASFLSPEGATRVLRGTSTKQATFRFTLWLPASWNQDPHLHQVLNQAFAGVFGYAPEPLPMDPEAAFAAQNASQSYGVPLIAWDSRLDELKIGLLDCPDIQKCPAGADSSVADLRFDLLRKAARVCAATFLVLRYENATTREFRKIIQAFPGNLHIYAFNQIRNLPAHEALAEVREALALPPDALCYGAYDYELRRYEKYTPSWDPNLRASATGGTSFPCFFQLTDNSAESVPDQISEERALHRLARTLDRQALVRDLHIETQSHFRELVEEGLGRVIKGMEDQERRLGAACRQVWESCHDSLSGVDGQRIILSADMAQDFADAIIRCGPWYIKGPLWAKATLFSGAVKIADFGRALTPVAVARFGRMISLATSKVKSNLIKPKPAEESIPTVFARRLTTRWRTSGHPVDEAEISILTERLFKRFNDVGLKNLPRKKWDEIAHAFWKQAPRGKAALTTAISLLAALGLLIYTALEPVGGTVLISFAIGKGLLALTVKELFVAAGLGALVGTACAIGLQKHLEADLGPLQRARFFALACDELGLPRHYPADAPPDTDLPPTLNRDGVCLIKLRLRSEKLEAGTVKSLRAQLQKLQ